LHKSSKLRYILTKSTSTFILFNLFYHEMLVQRIEKVIIAVSTPNESRDIDHNE